MPDTLTSPWPHDLFEFAFISAIDEQLQGLSALSEAEDWNYHNTQNDHPYPVLYNYIRYTYRRVAKETKISLSDDGQGSCFNTGLVTANQEPLYASFESNHVPGKQPWFFKAWLRRGERELTRFPELPDLAHYFDDPTCLVLDNRKEFRVNIEHIVADTPKDRFPEPFGTMENYGLQTIRNGSIAYTSPKFH